MQDSLVASLLSLDRGDHSLRERSNLGANRDVLPSEYHSFGNVLLETRWVHVFVFLTIITLTTLGF